MSTDRHASDTTDDLGAFVPAWWCRGAHAQTIWAATLCPPPRLAAHEEQWETPDGDFLSLDHVPAAAHSPILLTLHGLEGSSKTPIIRRFLRAARDAGWRGLAVNFRSCSGRLNRLARSYHGGDTSDLRWIIQHVTAQYPRAPLCCVGISLGANILLKYLGEEGDRVPAALTAAATISTPFDLAQSAQSFERGFFNRIYMHRLVRSLTRKTRQKLRRYPHLIDRRQLNAIRTIRQFDELVTAPVHGFASAAHYWATSSCRSFLASIRRPTLLINALDDPLVDADTMPRDILTANPYLSAVFPDAGGHTGFVSGTYPWQPKMWAQEKALHFFKQQLGPQSADL